MANELISQKDLNLPATAIRAIESHQRAIITLFLYRWAPEAIVDELVKGYGIAEKDIDAGQLAEWLKSEEAHELAAQRSKETDVAVKRFGETSIEAVDTSAERIWMVGVVKKRVQRLQSREDDSGTYNAKIKAEIRELRQLLSDEDKKARDAAQSSDDIDGSLWENEE